MSSSGEFVLTGNSSDLKSYLCLKILCVAALTSTPIKKVIDEESALCLLLPDGKTSLSSSNAILRTLSNFYPFKNLSGESLVSAAQVDSWMSFVWSSVEVPLAALAAAGGEGSAEQVLSDLSGAFARLNVHLSRRTYLVGEGVTLADVAGACAVGEAMRMELYDASSLGDLTRWHETVTHQEFYLQALNRGAAAAPSVVPAVIPNLFLRTRSRIVSLLSSPPIGREVMVKGWTRTTRNANKGLLLFVELNDGSCGTSLQCVLEKETTQGFEEAKGCGGAGSSFSFRGVLVESPAEGQAVELRVSDAELLGPVYGGDAKGTTVGAAFYPMSKKAHTLEHMRGAAHLRPRARLHAAAMRVRHAMAFATHKFFNDQGFLYIHTPIVTCADCEGAGEQFAVTTMLGTDHDKVGVELPKIQEEEKKEMSKKEQKRLEKKKKKAQEAGVKEVHKIPGAVDYSKDFFSRRANLTVSGQLNVETHACALSDVYTFGPTFRAENSHTGRHLSEFWMIEPEVAFATLTEDMNLAEDYLKYCVKYALDVCAEDLEFFENSPFGEVGLRARLQHVLAEPFMRLTYTEAISVLQDAVSSGAATFEEKVVWGIDLPTEMERYLCETIYKKPTILTNYPKEIKAFYMKLDPDEKTVAAADILVPKIGEIIGGSQREHRLDVLIRRCEETGLDPKSVWWYLDLRRYGTVPHSGFGLGFERLVLFVTGLDNIRDVIPFPRWPGNADF